jgi:hypothetical protein
MVDTGLLCAIKIGDGPGQAQHAVVAAHGETTPLESAVEGSCDRKGQSLARFAKIGAGNL